jgi:hypothetical protein
MAAGPTTPDYRAPRIPDQVLPTTWDELKRLYAGEDVSRGTQQQPNIILDILSLPPEERALAIAELERSTPPAGPPDKYVRPAPSPAPTPTPPPAPTGQLPLTEVPQEPPKPPVPPPAPTSAAASPADLLATIRAHVFDIEYFDPDTQQWGVADDTVSDTGRNTGRSKARTPPRAVTNALKTWNALGLDEAAGDQILSGRSTSAATTTQTVEPTPPAPPTPPAASTPVLATGDLVADVQASVMDNGSSNRGMDYWRGVFKDASPPALKSLATWMAGPAASNWVKRFMLPEVQELVAQDDQQGSMFGDADVYPPEPPRPASAPASDTAEAAGKTGEIVVDPEIVQVAPGRFQFKSNYDPAGVVPESRIQGKWDTDYSGVIMVWRDPANGQLYVINGHNRLDAAKRQHIPHILVREIQATDATEARTRGAFANIAEGNGTAVDAAKVIRTRKTDPTELLKSMNIGLNRRLATDAIALAKLSDPLFERVATGDLDQGLGIAIGQADLSPENQMAVVQLVDRQAANGKELTPKVLSHLIEDVRDAPAVTHASSQGDIFADILGEDRSQSVGDWLGAVP